MLAPEIPCDVHQLDRAQGITTAHRARQADGRVERAHSRPSRGLIDWARFEENQGMLLENAHMKRRAARKAGAGRTGAVHGSGAVRPVRPHDARLLRYADRSRAPLPVPGRRRSRRVRAVRRDRRRARRSGDRGRVLEAVSSRAVDAAVLAATRRLARRMRSVARSGASSRRPATRPGSRTVATNTLTRPSAMSRANSRPGGTQRWKGWPGSRARVAGWSPRSRRARGRPRRADAARS